MEASSTPRRALIVGDMQAGIVKNFGDDPTLIGNTKRAIDAARSAGVPVIFVRVAFREKHPDVSPQNKMFSGVAKAGLMLETDAGTQIHAGLEPAPGDPVVTKRRVGAFVGTDLEVLLRARRISALTLSGIATSGVILSTLRTAADLDYQVEVLSDAVKDADEEVNRVLLEKVFPRQAEVLTVSDWIAKIQLQA